MYIIEKKNKLGHSYFMQSDIFTSEQKRISHNSIREAVKAGVQVIIKAA